jgi:tetratricopeptide (TPR) repeat protein
MAPDDIKRKIAARLAALGVEGQEPPLLLQHFLGLPVPPEFLLRVPGTHLRSRTHEILSTVILRESARRPVVLVVENVHWVDASSAELLKWMAEQVPRHAVSLVLTIRPGVSMDWLPATTEWLSLEGLGPGEVEEMIRTLCASRSVAGPLAQLLMTKGAGNPLYVEEIVRQLRETHSIVVENGEARLSAVDVTVPETIRDIIAARVDRLAEPLKRTLQLASVVGRRFSVNLVSHMRETEQQHVADDLEELQAVDLVFPNEHDPELTYSFKHALTQEVVYSTLLERQRRRFHAAAGRGLEELYTSRRDDFVEILAYHFDLSAESEKAVDYAVVAAEKAQRRWANTEALALFEGALNRLASMPDTAPNQLRRIDAVVKQAEVKFALGRHAEHIQTLDSIQGTIAAVADPARRAAWYYWAGFFHNLTGARVDVPIAYCREAVAIADASGCDEVRPFAESCLAHALMTAGDLREAMRVGERALQTFEAGGNVWWACRTLWTLHPVANYLGQWERGLEYSRRALEYGRSLNDLRLKVVGWWRTGSTHIQRGDVEPGIRCCEEALALSPSAFDAAMVRAAHGYGLVKAGELERGTNELRDAVTWFGESKLWYSWSLFTL